MLKKIKLRNFRKHKFVEIAFSKTITTLVGPSYSGKSTVVRALKWVCLNKPSGTSLIRWGTREAEVSIDIDGKEITRVRGKGKNLYKLGDQKFAAFGNDVPKRIAQLINITEDNFQGQHALPFWFGDTSGTIAKKLNKIVNLSLIDTSLSYLSSELNRAKHTVTISESRLKEIKTSQKKLTFVSKMEEEWNAIKKYSETYKTLKQRSSDLKDIVKRYEAFAKIIQTIKPPSLKALTKYQKALEAVENRYTKLEIIIDKMEGLNGDLCNLQERHQNMQRSLKKISKNRCPTCGTKFLKM